MIRTVMGLILIVAGVLCGVYVGLWICFIGGIVQIIEQVRAPELSAMVVAIGVVKILFAGFIGFMSGLVAVIPGYALLSTTK